MFLQNIDPHSDVLDTPVQKDLRYTDLQSML